MGFKDFMYTEKGKITGSVLAAVLISAAVFVPVSIFTDRAVRGDDSSSHEIINAVAFDRTASTGEVMTEWAGIETVDSTDTEKWLTNGQVTFVEKDDALVRSVLSIENSVGFMGKNMASTQAETLGGEIQTYSVIEGGKEIGSDSEDYSMISPLNFYMKVPAHVAKGLKDAMYWQTGSSVFTEDLTSIKPEGDYAVYGNWLLEKGYEDDFAQAYAVYNYAIVSSSYNTDLNSADKFGDLTVDNSAIAGTTTDEDFYNSLEQYEKNLTAIFGEEVKVDNGTTNELIINGTGTADPAIQYLFADYNKMFEDNGSSTAYSYSLVNYGSSTAWFLPKEDIGYGDTVLVKGDNQSSGSTNAFLGTQSRRSYSGTYKGDISGMSNWGYANLNDTWGGTLKTETFDLKEIYEDSTDSKVIEFEMNDEGEVVSITNNGDITPLAVSIAQEPLVFFSEKGTTFDILNAEGEYETYVPTGITPGAAKAIFETGISWEQLFATGAISAELVA